VKILIATSNAGKLRDFAGAAAVHGVVVESIPNFSVLPVVVEDGETFEANSRKKAEEYSLAAPGEIVVADDSGLEVDALGGAPGVYSARYAADEADGTDAHASDAANNSKVLRELQDVPPEKRAGRFVCVLAAARDGMTLATFHGVVEGVLLDHEVGTGGFGYDPLFYFSPIGKTLAELSAEEKSRYSHRGAAFAQLLEWLSKRG
jgi:XTP/dITP diphosphohydrolase